MKIQITSVVLTGLLGLLTLVTRADASHNAEQLSGYKAVSFSKVKSASVAKITKDKNGAFHGYKVITEWRGLDDSSRAVLATLIQKTIDGWIGIFASAGSDDIVELSTFCIPDPGYAIRLETDRGSRDFLICLKCENVQVFAKRNQNVEFQSDGDLFSALEAYCNDEFVLRKGPEKKP